MPLPTNDTFRQAFGEHACHPERSEGSGSMDGEILRCAQDDSQNTSQVRSREVFSPNVCWRPRGSMALPKTRLCVLYLLLHAKHLFAYTGERQVSWQTL